MSLEFPPVALQAVLLLVVVTGAVFDARYRRIPNWLVLTGLVLGIGLNTFLFEWRGLRLSLLGLGLAFLIYFPLYLLRGMGAGDVKLMASIGSMVGAANWFAIFIITAVLGGIAALALLLSRNQLRRGLANVGVLLVELLSFRPPYARNEELDLASAKSMKLPHGVVIAWGSVLFLAAAWIWAPR
jgi:prepilin peptidase CpaA